jgi:hypothetical protein
MNDAVTHTSGLIRCPRCYGMLSGPWTEGGETLRNCERCGEFLRISVFPTLLIAPPLPMSPGVRAMEGDATCFFHPEKRAERSCDRCGRFLCALCDLPVGARHLCPACLKAGAEENAALPELVTKRVSYGRMSLLLALLGMLCFLTSPAAIFVALYGWNKPGSIVHGKRRISATFGLLIGSLQVAFLAYAMYSGWNDAIQRAP